jgi:hypothetical protein
VVTDLWGTFDGVIADIKDPEARGRVRVRVPQVSGLGVSGWADPAVPGAVAVGDQVKIAFSGGVVHWPVFWPFPKGAELGWQPLVMLSGWAAHPDARYGRPVARVTGDGMIELDGAVTSTVVPAAGTRSVAKLPNGWTPANDAYAVAGSTSTYETVLGAYMRVGIVKDGTVQFRIVKDVAPETQPVSVFMSGLRYRKI